MKQELIEKMIAQGARRWTKGEHDRLYIDLELLKCEKRVTKSTGWVQWYVYDQENSLRYKQGYDDELSNNKMNEMCKGVTVWIDLKNDEVHVGHEPGRWWVRGYKEEFQRRVQDLIGVCENELETELEK